MATELVREIVNLGYRMVYEIDAYNCSSPCLWTTIGKMKSIQYNRIFGKENVKFYFNINRYWQIYVKEDVWLNIMYSHNN